MSEINASNLGGSNLVEWFVYSLTASMNWLIIDAHNCEQSCMITCMLAMYNN